MCVCVFISRTFLRHIPFVKTAALAHKQRRFYANPVLWASNIRTFVCRFSVGVAVTHNAVNRFIHRLANCKLCAEITKKDNKNIMFWFLLIASFVMLTKNRMLPNFGRMFGFFFARARTHFVLQKSFDSHCGCVQSLHLHNKIPSAWNNK